MPRFITTVLILAVVVVAPGARGDDMTETVKALEKRVQELEAHLKKLSGAPEGAAAGPRAEAPRPETAAAPRPAAGQETRESVPSNGSGHNGNGWLWSAYFDGYYGYNFKHPAHRSNLLRNFDVSSSQFNLNYSELVLEHPAEPLGFRIDLGFGQAAEIVHAGDPSGSSLFRHLQQAYVSYKAPVGKGLVIDFGKFVTSLGAEVIETRDNYNYSRSLLFAYAIPYYHFGVRAAYPLASTLTVGGAIVNGWNNVTDNNTAKTYVGTATWTPHKRLAIAQNFITGPERSDSNRGWRSVWDTVVTVTAGNRLTLQGNYDYGMDRPDGFQRVHWTGVAGAFRYAVNNWMAIAPRLEWFNDADGFTTGLAQRVKEGTMTLEFKLHDGLISRLEYRRDWSSQPFFDSGARPRSAREQSTLLGGIIFSFNSPR